MDLRCVHKSIFFDLWSIAPVTIVCGINILVSFEIVTQNNDK